MFMELIVTQLVPDPKQYKNAAGHANGQSGDIDEGKSFMPAQISDGNF
jgi:hypothetical protein